MEYVQTQEMRETQKLQKKTKTSQEATVEVEHQR